MSPVTNQLSERTLDVKMSPRILNSLNVSFTHSVVHYAERIRHIHCPVAWRRQHQFWAHVAGRLGPVRSADHCREPKDCWGGIRHAGVCVFVCMVFLSQVPDLAVLDRRNDLQSCPFLRMEQLADLIQTVFMAHSGANLETSAHLNASLVVTAAELALENFFHQVSLALHMHCLVQIWVTNSLAELCFWHSAAYLCERAAELSSHSSSSRQWCPACFCRSRPL